MSLPVEQRVTPQGVTNWAMTYTSTPTTFAEPATIAEVQALVRDAAASGRSVRAVGSAHSPNACAMSNDIIISLRRMKTVVSLDENTRVVTAQAGCTVEQLHPWLDARGLAFPNLGSISEQSLAGMISTGTHGTGRGAGCLATFVTALELVVGDGTLLSCSRTERPDLFRAALCSLGVLGVVVTVSFRAVPSFDLHAVEAPCSLADVLATLPQRVASAPFYRFWWFPHTGQCIEWRARPVAPVVHRARHAPGWLGRLFAWVREDLIGFHGLQAALALALGASKLGLDLVPAINRWWYGAVFNRVKERVDRSDRIFNINCLFKQHVDEWALPVDELPSALAGLQRMIEGPTTGAAAEAADSQSEGSGQLGHGVHYPIEVRFTAGDDIWLSPSHGRATAWIGVIAYKPYGLETPYKKYFLSFERLMARHGGRPHWAKDFHWRGDDRRHFAAAYPRWGDFLLLRAALDPAGVFLNPWARRTLGLEAEQQQEKDKAGASSVEDRPIPRPAAQQAGGSATDGEEAEDEGDGSSGGTSPTAILHLPAAALGSSGTSTPRPGCKGWASSTGDVAAPVLQRLRQEDAATVLARIKAGLVPWEGLEQQEEGGSISAAGSGRDRQEVVLCTAGAAVASASAAETGATAPADRAHGSGYGAAWQQREEGEQGSGSSRAEETAVGAGEAGRCPATAATTHAAASADGTGSKPAVVTTTACSGDADLMPGGGPWASSSSPLAVGGSNPSSRCPSPLAAVVGCITSGLGYAVAGETVARGA